jgi:hypothetical protein
MHRLTSIAMATLLISTTDAAAEPAGCIIHRWHAPEAVQAVAVDEVAFYAIANGAIGKYDKSTRELINRWTASDETPLCHLNSGVVIEGTLYCAHSNFPAFPNTSSVEMFDVESLAHIGSHSFGIYEGSLTWVDRYDNAWWCVFAHYSEKVNDDPRAKPHTYTSLVRFDDQWRRTGGWVFPRALLDRFSPHSCSGGGWGPDGKLYATGHDLAEVYQLRLPKAGSTLKFTRTVPLQITGQGVAWDRTRPGVLFGIDRAKREVVVSQVPLPCGQRRAHLEPSEATPIPNAERP